MINLLAGSGIPAEFRNLFGANGAVFDYGDCIEHFGQDFHRVPVTKNLWLAGDQTATQAIIGTSAIELIAFLSLRKTQYPKIDMVALIAIGSKWHVEQAAWIRDNFCKRKFTLVFGNDYLGRITDVKMACALKEKIILIHRNQNETVFLCGTRQCVISNDTVSLYALERAMGWRSGISCPKSKQNINFLEELKNGK